MVHPVLFSTQEGKDVNYKEMPRTREEIDRDPSERIGMMGYIFLLMGLASCILCCGPKINGKEGSGKEYRRSPSLKKGRK